jgi:hypothetical protein
MTLHLDGRSRWTTATLQSPTPFSNHTAQLDDLAQTFVHFDTCQGLVLASFAGCSRSGNALGAAKGRTGLGLTGMLLAVFASVGLLVVRQGKRERTKQKGRITRASEWFATSAV